MKTYEQELNELLDWMKIQDQKYFEACKKDRPKGRDSKLDRERRQVFLEYNRRLAELKKNTTSRRKKKSQLRNPKGRIWANVSTTFSSIGIKGIGHERKHLQRLPVLPDPQALPYKKKGKIVKNLTIFCHAENFL